LALGLALIGVSEWARRDAMGHPLAAALLAGAGVVALYAATWAAHGLYGMADATTALLLLAACAGVLIGLSFLHGEPLGVLAAIAALLAPALAGSAWPQPALTLFACAMAATGFALAARRRGPWVGLVTLVGLYFWFAASIADAQWRRALAMLSTASLGAALVALRAPLEDAAPRRLSWADARAYGPSIGIAISSVLLLWVWLSAAPLPSGRIAGPALIAAFHVALASYAVRAKLANYWALAVAIGATLLGFMAYLQARIHFGPLGVDFYPTILTASLIVALCTITARPHREGCAPISRVMCRCVTCAISCARTDASSDSLSAATSRPVCTPTKPPGRANALIAASRTAKNSNSWRASGIDDNRRRPSCARKSVISASSTYAGSR
jgi:uncharacterized membrane protein